MPFKTIPFRIVAFCLLTITFTKLYAQSYDAIPPFKMLMTNGRFFSSSDLPKNKPVILIYFAPECEHCQALMNEFFRNIEAFKTVQIVLVTFKPVQELSPFEKTYETYKYENIKVGTEGTSFFLRKFFRLDTTPFTALYNKDGKLIHSYKKETPVEDLVDRVKQL